ncbi:ATP-binding protein [Streptomyces decoyicus]|uniref:ATP-binding protein n=1 Tax=Streptomyces decoyicus TaxID=249567 RepID=UPI003650ADF0
MTTTSEERLPNGVEGEPLADAAHQLTSLGPEQVRGAVREDLSLSIKRQQHAPGRPVPESDGRWVRRLRRIGRAKLRYWGYQSLLDDLGLLISELVTNALRHGSGEEVDFRLVVTTEVVLLQVGDGSSRRPRVRDAHPEEETGRGMVLVDAFAASWGVSADGTTTWCTLTIPETRRSPWPLQLASRDECPHESER